MSTVSFASLPWMKRFPPNTATEASAASRLRRSSVSSRVLFAPNMIFSPLSSVDFVPLARIAVGSRDNTGAFMQPARQTNGMHLEIPDESAENRDRDDS